MALIDIKPKQSQRIKNEFKEIDKIQVYQCDLSKPTQIKNTFKINVAINQPFESYFKKIMHYPKEKFLQVVQDIKKSCIVIWGSEQEKEKAEWLSSESDYIQLMPKLSLDDLKCVIGHASLLIGNDTGPSHIAWASNIPSIILFGPTPIERSFQTPINTVLSSNSKINHYKLNKNDFSIKEIKVSDVVKIAKELLGLSL